jgi:hypothetical protein
VRGVGCQPRRADTNHPHHPHHPHHPNHPNHPHNPNNPDNPNKDASLAALTKAAVTVSLPRVYYNSLYSLKQFLTIIPKCNIKNIYNLYHVLKKKSDSFFKNIDFSWYNNAAVSIFDML